MTKKQRMYSSLLDFIGIDDLPTECFDEWWEICEQDILSKEISEQYKDELCFYYLHLQYSFLLECKRLQTLCMKKYRELCEQIEKESKY